MRYAALGLIASLPGCFTPGGYPAGQPCSDAGRCPPGQVCGADGLCTTEAAARDGGLGGEVSADARVGSPAIVARGVITSGDSDSRFPALAWRPAAIGVVYEHTTSGGSPEIRMVQLPDTLDQTGADALVSLGQAAHNGSIAWSGSRYWVAWQERPLDGGDARVGVDLRSIDEDGGAGVVNAPSGGRSATGPSIAADSTAVALVWKATQTDGREAIAFHIQGSCSVVVHVSAGAALGSPCLAHAGDKYWVGWSEGGELGFQAVGRDCAKDGSSIEGIAGAEPDLVSGGAGTGVVWERSGNVYFARAEALEDAVQINDVEGVAHRPAVSWSPAYHEFAAVWSDERDGAPAGREIYMARVSAGGAAIGANVPLPNGAGDSDAPDIAWGSDQYVVVWHDNAEDGRQTDYEIYAAGVRLP